MIKEFKQPDLNAPRRRIDTGYRLIKRTKGSSSGKESNAFLKEFKEKYPQYKDMSVNTACDILETFHGKLWDHALKNRDGIELLEGLGYIFLGTCNSPKKYNADYKTLMRENITTRYRNFESDNKLAKIFYTNYSVKYKFKNREMWYFTATRDFKRAVAPIYRENWKTYITVENGKSISKYMKRAMKKNFFRYLEANYQVDSSYNEFDLN
jgi:hypothetical protein